MTPMAGCWRATSANICPAIRSIVPQNRPGAGSLNLANYLFNAAPKDGTEIAIVGRGVAMEPLLGGAASQAKFDSTQVRLARQHEQRGVGLLSSASPARPRPCSRCWRARRLQVGSTGIGGDQHVFTAALNSLLGTKLKAIAGYPGTQEIMLAVERGELDGIVGYSWGVARSGNKSDLESGKLKIILQLALDKHKELPDVPMVTDFVSKPDDRQVLEMIFSRQSMGRPLVAPPGLDPRVVDAAAQGVRGCHARSAVHRGGRAGLALS